MEKRETEKERGSELFLSRNDRRGRRRRKNISPLFFSLTPIDDASRRVLPVSQDSLDVLHAEVFVVEVVGVFLEGREKKGALKVFEKSRKKRENKVRRRGREVSRERRRWRLLSSRLPPPHPNVDPKNGDVAGVAQLLHQGVVLVRGRLFFF